MKRGHASTTDAAASRLALEEELGYLVCGINRCILPNKHAGDCIFSFSASRRSCAASAEAASKQQRVAEPAAAEAESAPRPPRVTRSSNSTTSP